VKVVLDTNILVSGLMTRGGNSAVILDHVVQGSLTACADDRMFDEYERVCVDPGLKLDTDAVHDFLSFLRYSAEQVVPRPLGVVIPDPDDVPFLEVAAASDAVLITGNRKHFPAKNVGRVRVASPAEFMALFHTFRPE